MNFRSNKTNFAARNYRQLIMVGWAGMFLLFPSCVFALDIEEVIWGFGTQQARGKCVPLSLLLSNNTPEGFDELIQLNRLQFSGSIVGAPLCRKVYLAPYSSQWVQFYPYLIDKGREEWSLNWGPRFIYSRKFASNGSVSDNNQTDEDPLTRIILTSSTSLTQSGGAFKRYPEELFPPAVTATDSLDEVILDHVPRWDAARKVSFMDWLFKGGTLHLLPDPSGTDLNFTTSMAELNIPQDHFRVGSGLVIRHPATIQKLTKKQLVARMLAAHTDEFSTMAATTPSTENIQPTTQSENDSYSFGDANADLLQIISEITRPDHNWTIIYAMSVLYIFIIFPGCYLFNKRQKSYHYRNSLLFLLIMVAVFSTVFWRIGKRGYGETTAINSVIIAHPLKDDQCDVTCWNNAFVTDGAKYQFSSSGDGIIFTTAQEAEKVKGAIFNGVEGRFYSDIPPFSSRSFMYRIKAPFKNQNIKVLEYKIGANSILESLKLELSPAFPKNPLNLHVLYGRTLYHLSQTQENDRTCWTLHKARTPLTAWQSTMESDSNFARRAVYLEEEKESHEIYELLYRRLVLKELNLIRPGQLRNYQSDKARVKVFLYTALPEELKLKTNVQGAQQGRALFVYDLPLPEQKNATENE